MTRSKVCIYRYQISYIMLMSCVQFMVGNQICYQCLKESQKTVTVPSKYKKFLLLLRVLILILILIILLLLLHILLLLLLILILLHILILILIERDTT